nr:lysine histidine transporter-like 8 [Ipomoea batatas]
MEKPPKPPQERGPQRVENPRIFGAHGRAPTKLASRLGPGENVGKRKNLKETKIGPGNSIPWGKRQGPAPLRRRRSLKGLGRRSHVGRAVNWGIALAAIFRKSQQCLNVQTPSSRANVEEAKVAYSLIAMSLFPIAIGGFWAYGNLMPPEGILSALFEFHIHDIPRGLLAMTFLLVVFNCLSSFQIYSMPVFDSFEASYTSRTNRPCSVWVRSGFRVFYGFFSILHRVALPFLSSLTGLLGGLTLPVTFAYPCFMWVLIKKPTKYSFNWYFNWILGWLGVALSVTLSIGGIWSMVNSGLKLKFFNPPG